MFGDAAEPLLAAARVLLRDQADPGSQIPTGLRGLRVRHAGNQRCRDQRPDAGNAIEPSTGLASTAACNRRCAIRDGSPYSDEVVSPLSSAAPVLVSKPVRLIADLAGRTFDA